MTDPNPPAQPDPPSSPTPPAQPPADEPTQQLWSTPPDAPPQAPPPPAQPAYGGGYGVVPQGPGPVGQVRSTGMAILLTIVTLGIYSLYWFFVVHEEMKRHRGVGIGGGIALLLALFVGIVMPYLTSSEAGDLYAARGQAKPVSAATGLWYFPGMFILVGPIIWFVKTNGAINDYWRSLGAV